MILAEALRKMHNEGRTHGALAPCNIVVTATGVELADAPLMPDATPYAAPEVLQGQPAEVSVNDGTVPEVEASVHSQTLAVPAASK